MPRLLIKSGAWPGQTVELNPGVNRIGRSEDNDLRINDGSISSDHCEIVWANDTLLVRDLDSTNGTFINRLRVKEAVLHPGQTLHLGNVEIELEAPPVHIAIPTMASPVALQTPTAPKFRLDGAACCLNHPAALASLECTQCEKFYCEVCVRGLRRMGGQALKFCPACGARCERIGWRKGLAPARKTFFGLLPGAFLYPFKREGVILLTAGTLFYVGLNFLARFSWIATIFASGYLFAYLQKIILSSARGDEVLPSWPEFSDFWEDIGQPFLNWVGTLAVSFGPAILGYRFSPQELKFLALPLLVFGIFYFPMALLAVAMHDRLAAVNPVLVLFSVFQVPLAYTLSCGLLVLIAGVELVSEMGMRGIHLPVLPALLAGFVSLYFLTVEMRVLGLLYFSNQDRLRWFN